MASSTINVLLTSFPGLRLPSTLSLPIPATTTISDFRVRLFERVALIDDHFILTTISNKQLPLTSSSPLSNLLSSTEDVFLSLRLSVPLCGGKGGFGSQLRAAGGRMSSKRKKNQGDNNGSSRNLDGRRLRTVTEAKALAEYLAIKPDMEKNEKEQQRKRLEQIVELAQRKEDEIKTGSKGRIDGRWVEDKEEASERTHEAVLVAMDSGIFKDHIFGRTGEVSTSASQSGNFGAGDKLKTGSISGDQTPEMSPDSNIPRSRKLFGFEDEDAEFLSDDDDNYDDGGATNVDEMVTEIMITKPHCLSASLANKNGVKGKGKGKFTQPAKPASNAVRKRKAR